MLQDQGFTIGQIIPEAVVLMFILNELVSLGEISAKLGVGMPVPVKSIRDIQYEGEKSEITYVFKQSLLPINKYRIKAPYTMVPTVFFLLQ